MNSRMMTCARCGGIQWQGMVDVRTMVDPGPVLMPGRWEACEECGHTGEPTVPPTPCPPMRAFPLGPPIPSPEDLLRAAGLFAW